MRVRALARTLGKMAAPDALPPSGLPSTVEVCRVLSELNRRHFSRETHAHLLDADVTGGVLTVVAWQPGSSPEDRGRVIAHRTGLGMRLAECEGIWRRCSWMCCSSRRTSRAGRHLGPIRHGCSKGTPRPPGTSEEAGATMVSVQAGIPTRRMCQSQLGAAGQRCQGAILLDRVAHHRARRIRRSGLLQPRAGSLTRWAWPRIHGRHSGVAR